MVDSSDDSQSTDSPRPSQPPHRASVQSGVAHVVPDAVGDALDAVGRALTSPRTVRVVIGRRPLVSLAFVLLAPLLAAATAYRVSTTIGFETLESWALTTWMGTSFEPLMLAGVAALVALGTLSALANDGLLPTAVLVGGPVFGAAVTYYGTTVQVPPFDPYVVTLPAAVAYATYVAVTVGGPIAVAGYGIGASIRRVVASASN